MMDFLWKRARPASRLEEAYAHDEHLIDRANHLLLVGRSRTKALVCN